MLATTRLLAPRRHAAAALLFSARRAPASTQSHIEHLAQQPVTPVTLAQLIHIAQAVNAEQQQHVSATRPALVDNARFLSKELPVRLAKRCSAMQRLPFIVGTNPHIRRVYEQYWHSFEVLHSLPAIKTAEDERAFMAVLRELVTAHASVIPLLSKGFVECKGYITADAVGAFLDQLIHARIGIRVLAEHHLALHDPQPSFLGVIDTSLSPAQLTRQVYSRLEDICFMHLGHVPPLQVDGKVDTRVVYLPVHLDYMLSELLKNSMRATVEHWQHHRRRRQDGTLPSVRVTVASDGPDVVLRIRDRGGGVPYDQLQTVFEYSYTTVPSETTAAAGDNDVVSTDQPAGENVFAYTTQTTMQADTGGPMAGLGYGLGTSRVYARYFGGTLHMVSLYGHGCDVFLRIRSIDKDLHDRLV